MILTKLTIVFGAGFTCFFKPPGKKSNLGSFSEKVSSDELTKLEYLPVI